MERVKFVTKSSVVRRPILGAKHETKKCVSLCSEAITTIGCHFVMKRLLVVSILPDNGNGCFMHDAQGNSQAHVTYAY